MLIRRLVLALPFLAASCGAHAVPFHQARNAVAHACLTNVDINHDGYVELEYARRIAGEKGFPYEAAGGDKGTVLVFVESRLLRPLPGARPFDESLRTYIQDLAKEGYNAFALEVKLEPGLKQRQGGLDTLALRRVLQEDYRRDPGLKGVVLLGRFPYAIIVRQEYWERDDDITINEGKKSEKKFSGKHWARDVPEYVALTADCVLADLDGNWEKLYQMKPKPVPYFIAVYPGKDVTVPTKDYELGTITFSDFFLIQDGSYIIKDTPDGKVFGRGGQIDAECTPADLKLPNPMGRPEIAVSHLDASMVALEPNAKLANKDGVPIVDSLGRPQAVKFEKGKVPGGNQVWDFDPYLERQLLCEYFQRNHAYRTGKVTDGRRPGSFSWEWDSSFADYAKNVPGWQNTPPAGLDYLGTKISINDWIEWMQRPVLLRAIKAHANPWVSEYGRSPDPAKLSKLLGYKTCGWDRTQDSLVPASYASGVGRYEFYRALWENHSLPPTPSMFLHIGCEGTIPPSWDTLPYGNPNWGKFQAEEALVMYCNGLVLIGRGKGFNDEPVDVGKVLGSGGTWGDVWTHYFDADSKDAGLNGDNGVRIARKRAYFWATLGDWTVTLFPKGIAAK
jgi:hypothetical protein